jgi:hypothetical protein
MFLIASLGSSRVMANAIGMSPTAGNFTLSWAGGMEYGSREITFDGERRFYLARGDTINSQSQTGVGVFELDIQNEMLSELKSVAGILCDGAIQKGGPETFDPPATFAVTCLQAGKIIRNSGSLRLIPENLQRKLFAIVNKFIDLSYVEGKKIIKLDFLTDKIEHENNSIVVSVRFINSGNRWIKFTTPDQWPGTSVGGDLGVAPDKKIGNDNVNNKAIIDWGVGLAGRKLLNRDEFPEGIVTLKPGEARILKFQAIPDNKVSKGEYEFSGAAFMHIEYEGEGWGLSTHVDFKPIKTRITIDRDYPSTPQEREEWEETHRATMSSQPVKPGETFAEDGLYRAVRLIAGASYRSLQVKPFKAGDIATTEDVRMPMESANGVEINGPVQWVWEGSAPTRATAFSSDYIAGTEHLCAPGTTCPRSGRWVARTRTSSDYSPPIYRHDLLHMIALRQGQKMPEIQGDAGKAEWEWVGV